MKKARNGFIKNLRYLCLIGVIALGLITIVGSNGGDGDGNGAGEPCAVDDILNGADADSASTHWHFDGWGGLLPFDISFHSDGTGRVKDECIDGTFTWQKTSCTTILFTTKPATCDRELQSFANISGSLGQGEFHTSINGGGVASKFTPVASQVE